ncbi:MAG: serine hydrolase domain-containing protein [Candidatus Zhuqueibacterota bacterium]
MKPQKIFACLLAFALLLGGCSSRKLAVVETLFQPYTGKTPGASVMVIQQGQPILTKSFGLAHVEDNVPVEPATNFRLASFTKQFTAMCIMQLAEQGALSYDQHLTDIFPDFPDYGKQITIRQILNHTSGLIDYESLIPDTATIQVLDRDVLAMMKAQDSTYFSPGAQYRYSNSGYAVLAMIVEKISGQRFAEYLKQHIFDPAGMTQSVALEAGISTAPHRAFGYAAEDGVLVPRDQSLTSAVLGDGGIYSSVVDLFKWDQVLYTEKLVTSESLQRAFTPGSLQNGEKLEYGFGWRIDEYKGHRRVHHTGGTCGFATIIQRYPDDHFSIIILTNRAEPALNQTADALADLYLIRN